MGWRAIYKDGTEKREDIDGRPVQDGEEGKLLVITQEDYGHTVAVDLINGIIYIDYENLVYENGDVRIENPKLKFWIAEETSIVGLLPNIVRQELVPLRDENGRKIIGSDGRFALVRNDITEPILWRPIWFTRWTNGDLTKVIGAQTTTPKDFGARNVKKMISLYSWGEVGID